MSSYIPSSAAERAEMLRAIGLNSADELYSVIPDSVRLKRPLNLPAGVSELELRTELKSLAGKNKSYSLILRGAGAYEHYVPEIVRAIASREEFVTAYTPYQAEISQGVLQAIFEYQSMICTLTGMDVSNASVYDGATAVAEGAAMTVKKNRRRILASAALNPMTLEVLRTYSFGSGNTVETVPEKDGVTDLTALDDALGADAACVIIQSPNKNGLIEDVAAAAGLTHAAGALLVQSSDPLSLMLYKSPAELGADIAVGDGQPLGMPLSYGGPYLGYMACTSKLTRSLPGRIVGETVDADGERAFVLTLQAREQHIRRENASSNICSNEALCALTAAVYISAMGASGMREAALQSHSKAVYFAGELAKLGYNRVHDGEFFCEFVTTAPTGADRAIEALAERGILGGLPVDGGILWCVTETASRAALDEAVSILREVK